MAFYIVSAYIVIGANIRFLQPYITTDSDRPAVDFLFRHARHDHPRQLRTQPGNIVRSARSHT